MQMVSIGEHLHEMSNPVFWVNKKNISKCLLKILPGVLSVKTIHAGIFLILWSRLKIGLHGKIIILLH